MKLVALLPVKCIAFVDWNIYECTFAEFAKHFKRENIVYGFDSDDDIAILLAKEKNLHYVVEEYIKPFPMCRLWMRMAEYAAERMSATHVILLGDDVEIHDAARLKNEVKSLSRGGYDCVAVRESRHPSWPTFLAMSTKAFVTPFFRGLFYGYFINQDGDPFLFEYFRRSGKACFTLKVHLTNARGGVEGGLNKFNEPRYDRCHVPWKHLLPSVSTMTTIDVCVPMYRINVEFVRDLLTLDVPPNCDTRFCVCLDSKPTPEQVKILSNLETRDHRLRVRINDKNMGASETRNRLMKESHYDWILFLDDDVVPSSDIIVEYHRAILKNPESRGFVGLSEIPRDGRLWTDAIHVSTLYFWHIARHTDQPVAWGVTANLLIKWDPTLQFDSRFPKTGGGEDIDLCVQMGNSLIPVKNAKITHPWRDSPFKMYRRMFEWAVGDGILNSKYPKLTFHTFPNAIEILLIWMLFASASTAWIPCFAELITHVIAELCVHPMFHDGKYAHDILTKSSTTRRFVVVLLGCLSRNVSDAGHFWGHLTRAQFHRVGTRFDWFVGKNKKYVAFEQCRNVLFYVVLFMTVDALKMYRNFLTFYK